MSYSSFGEFPEQFAQAPPPLMQAIGGYSLIKSLGIGAFSKVWLAQAPSGEYVAIKTTQLVSPAEKKQLECFQRAQEEASHMKMVQHANLVPMIDTILEQHEDGRQSFHLVLPYYAGGDLLDYLRRRRCVSEPEARHFFTEMCLAVAQMHNSGLIHRDLKLENFFLSADQRHVHVGDFGFAGKWSRDKTQNKSWGSIHYASPEICSSAPYYGPEVDIWSLGVVLYALLCGKLPFNGDNDFAIYQQIVAANIVLPPSCSVEVHHLLKALLNPVQAERINMAEIFAHPWMQMPSQLPVGSPQIERRGSHESFVSPLNLDRVHARRTGSSALAIKEKPRRGSVSSASASEDDQRSPSQRSPLSSASSSPKSAGSRMESSSSPSNTPREMSRRPSRFININGGKRFSLSGLTAKLVHAVLPGARPPSPAVERSPSPVTGSPPNPGTTVLLQPGEHQAP